MWRKAFVQLRGSAEEGVPRNGRQGAAVRPLHRAPHQEGEVYCEVVLDVHSRSLVGWSIDSHQTAGLAANALAAPASGLVPSMGSIGGFDHAVLEAFWG